MTQDELENIYTDGYLYDVLDDVSHINCALGTKSLIFHGNNIILDLIKSGWDAGDFHITIRDTNLHLSRLEEEFIEPLEPTTHELALFEINHGIPYPLIPYLKCLSPTQQGE